MYILIYTYCTLSNGLHIKTTPIYSQRHHTQIENNYDTTFTLNQPINI